MSIKLFKFVTKNSFAISPFYKRASLAIKHHFQLSDYQIFILCWLKGLWAGILIAFVIHHLVRH